MDKSAASNMIGRSCELRAAKAKEKPKGEARVKARAKANPNVLSPNNLEKDVLANVSSVIDREQARRTQALNAIAVEYADNCGMVSMCRIRRVRTHEAALLAEKRIDRSV